MSDELSPATQYLKKRGITSEIAAEFKMGYATSGWSDLTHALQRGRAPLASAEKLGLIKKKINGEYFDLFRDRVIFPIVSTSGNVLGFGGRSRDGARAQQPKYLNSSDSSIFSKGKTLYGLHVERPNTSAPPMKFFLVEGYMDLLALYQFGIKNVVATLGTAFTAEHAKAIQKLCAKVIVLFDGDEAGQSAAEKSLPFLLDAGLFSRCLTLPNQFDPDEFLRERGPEEFHRLAREAPDHFLSFFKQTDFPLSRGNPQKKWRF